MISTYASRDRIRYHYYVSAPCIRGAPDGPVGSVTRVPAPEIEAVISKAVMANIALDSERPSEDPDNLSRDVIERSVIRIEVRRNQLAIHLRPADGSEPDTAPSHLVVVPWKKPSKPPDRSSSRRIRPSIAGGP